jgi:hypothetical protein
LVAFINRGDGDKLYVLAAGNETAVKVTDYPVRYINSWSTDSSKILVYSPADDLVKRKEPEGMGEEKVWDLNETFIVDSAPGFHSFNVNTGKDSYLYPLVTAEKFIDDKRILTEQNKNKDARYVLFNVDNFTADFTTVSNPIGSFSRQTTFTADGNYWARTNDGGSTGGDVKIVLGTFPVINGETVDTAPWAFIQRPLLTPDGKYLAYTKKGAQIESGQFKGQYPDTTVVWDTSTKKVVKEMDGHPQYWVDSKVLVIGRAIYGSNSTGFSSFDLYHADTQATESFLMK